jgi:hypothetical protein
LPQIPLETDRPTDLNTQNCGEGKDSSSRRVFNSVEGITTTSLLIVGEEAPVSITRETRAKPEPKPTEPFDMRVTYQWTEEPEPEL